MARSTLRLYKFSGLLTSMAAISIVVLAKLEMYIEMSVAIPGMLTLISISAFCCAGTQKETGSTAFSKFCTGCGVLLIICAIAILILNYLPEITAWFN